MREQRARGGCFVKLTIQIKKAVEISRELVHNTFLHLHWPLKAFSFSTTFLPPPSLSSHRPYHGQFLSAGFVSFLLHFPDITTLPPLASPTTLCNYDNCSYGLEEIEFPISLWFLYPTSFSLCCLLISLPLAGWSLLCDVIRYIGWLYMCVFGMFPVKTSLLTIKLTPQWDVKHVREGKTNTTSKYKENLESFKDELSKKLKVFRE